ncbi:aspartate aminotransferase [Endozoicomonas sp. OPT23]|uniref:pyridoxal phosphate-dependent aminotransferase n=1 Tax=Endozoicomonas sp. OPT23 TaxID=2072845 RepID=UPI00129B240E|nr:pyridoxal phosphate-dependent aminotransferase [Endozoicomonas sp. OPT23]MRI32098.1 aspartate aminotransferase [Endozoicomonas sp. OPT23]
MFELDQLNPNVRGLKTSATLRINEDSNRLIQQGRDIIKLGLGQSPFPVPRVVVEALQVSAHEKDYLPVRGLGELRQIVAEYYQKRDHQPRTQDSILVGPGSKELLFNLQMACNGDLLIPAPSWVSYAPQAELLGRKVIHIETRPENNWQIDPEQLDRLCQDEPNKTKVLILNYPSNPTGCSYDSDGFSALAAVAKKNNLIIVADEIYAETAFEANHLSMAEYYPEGTVISSGLSKWCGAGGWRLGVMVFPDELRALQDAMAVIASETFTSISAPTQYAACTAFSPSPALDAYLRGTRSVLSAIASYMTQTLRSYQLNMVDPVGGFYLFVGFDQWREKLKNQGINSDAELCAHLLSETGIAILPGSDFGMTPEQLYTRMAFVDFDGGRALSVAGDESLPDNFIEEYCPKLVKACQGLDQWLKAL